MAIPEGAFGLEIFDAQFHGATVAAALVTFALLAVPVSLVEIRADRRRYPQQVPWQPPEGSDQP